MSNFNIRFFFSELFIFLNRSHGGREMSIFFFAFFNRLWAIDRRDPEVGRVATSLQVLGNQSLSQTGRQLTLGQHRETLIKARKNGRERNKDRHKTEWHKHRSFDHIHYHQRVNSATMVIAAISILIGSRRREGESGRLRAKSRGQKTKGI